MTSSAVAVGPEIWGAIAGYNTTVPSIGSLVYYFPEGHAEHLNNNNVPELLPFPPFSQPVPSFFLCHVLGVEFLADPFCDQVFAKFRLLPSLAPHAPHGGDDFQVRNDGIVLDIGGGENKSVDDVVSFGKILTPSDANNGGGFSVPRFCADSIFPPLNFTADPPVQNLVINDVHGNSFHFRHIYRGTPRRHLLTSGWSKFVNAKKLVAGDSVIFIRKRSTEELFVGIRRALRSSSHDCSWLGQPKLGSESKEGLGFWSMKGRDVVDTVERASRGMAFDVVYYPRPGWADFVVRADLVEESMNVPWSGGMRVKLAMETEDSLRLAWFHGTVSSASVPENGPWFGSPWRMLQITWDEPEILQNCKRISPWQVEHAGTTAFLNSAFPPVKKVKVFQNCKFLADAEENLLHDPMVGLLGPLAQKYTPVGIQGARQDQFCFSSLFNCNSDITRQASIDDCVNADVNSKLATVSTDLSVGSPGLESLSSNSENNIRYFGNDVAGKQTLQDSAKAGSSSFLLFGKIIHLEEPVTLGFDYVGCRGKESKDY